MEDQDQTLDQVPVEDLEVGKKPLNPTSKIGTEEFAKALLELLNGKEIWRSSVALAKKLEVDTRELDDFLRNQPTIAIHPGKEEGVFFYALVKRLSPQEKEKLQPATRPVVEEVERYALSMLKACELQLELIMNQYALKIHSKNKEAFTLLIAAKEKFEAGVAVYATSLKADMSKFPKV